MEDRPPIHAFGQSIPATRLTEWLDGCRRGAPPYANESSYLLVSDSGPQVSGDRLNKIVVQAANDTGIQKVLYEDAGDATIQVYLAVVAPLLRHLLAPEFEES